MQISHVAAVLFFFSLVLSIWKKIVCYTKAQSSFCCIFSAVVNYHTAFHCSALWWIFMSRVTLLIHVDPSVAAPWMLMQSFTQYWNCHGTEFTSSTRCVQRNQGLCNCERLWGRCHIYHIYGKGAVSDGLQRLDSWGLVLWFSTAAAVDAGEQNHEDECGCRQMGEGGQRLLRALYIHLFKVTVVSIRHEHSVKSSTGTWTW